MSTTVRPRLIGLTGGIASGKSTVSAQLRALGAPLLDADVLAREVVEPGQPALPQIEQRFPGVVGPDGRLDRKALGARIFGHPGERAALNAIVHPRIHALFMERTQALADEGAKVIVYDAPLLIENNLHLAMDGVILVSVPVEVQRARLMARDGINEAEADQRLASQLSLEAKRPHATWIIDNTGSLGDTHAQVKRVWNELCASTTR